MFRRNLLPKSWTVWTLNTEATGTSEKSVTTYQQKLRHIPQYLQLHQHRCQNSKCRKPRSLSYWSILIDEHTNEEVKYAVTYMNACIKRCTIHKGLWTWEERHTERRLGRIRMAPAFKFWAEDRISRLPGKGLTFGHNLSFYISSDPVFNQSFLQSVYVVWAVQGVVKHSINK